MLLTDAEKAMFDGREGKARQKAMDLLVRYGEALGAERFVDTRNVAGVPGSANPFLQSYYKELGAGSDVIFSYFDLDADELVEVPQTLVHTCHLQGGADPEHWETLGVKPAIFKGYQDREAFAASKGVVDGDRGIVEVQKAASRRLPVARPASAETHRARSG
jgi:hypothetical protein